MVRTGDAGGVVIRLAVALSAARDCKYAGIAESSPGAISWGKNWAKEFNGIAKLASTRIKRIMNRDQAGCAKLKNVME